VARVLISINRAIPKQALPVKNPDGGIAVSYGQTGRKLQSWRKKLILTTKPALIIRMDIICIGGRFNMLGCSWNRYTIHYFRFVRSVKATSSF
jgi:hypothetical protein